MPRVDTQIETSAKIKVIGVGGSGKNAVNHMINSNVHGVQYICMNTDSQDLHLSKAEKKITIGKNLTKGQGTGMDPELGKMAAEETRSDIQEAIKGADMVFIACGMGGGTGTGAAPIIARIAKDAGVLTVAVVTKPFAFEGEQRRKIAERGIEDVRTEVDALIVISNDQLLSVSDEDTTFENAFKMVDDVLKNAVQGISDLITTPGTINIDFADIRTILYDAGVAFMGIGSATGEKRAEQAAYQAINSPLLDMAVMGARGILFSITGSGDLKMTEVDTAAKIITEQIDPEAKVIFGSFKDDSLEKGELKVTVIAAGFQQTTKQQNRVSERPSSQKNFVYNSEPQHQPEDSQDGSDSVEIEFEDEENEWSNIPAFLRNRKKKGE